MNRVIASAALAIVASTAWGQQPPPPGGAPTGAAGPPPATPGVPPANPHTHKVDKLFAALDANKDGAVTRAEMQATGMTDRLFTFCDPDKSESISLAELQACSLPDALDMDRDGELTLDEMLRYEKTAAGRERGPGEARPE